MKSYLSYILLLITLAACKSDKQVEEILKKSKALMNSDINISSKVAFQLDSLTSNYSPLIQYDEEGKFGRLIYLNKNLKAVDFYDLSSKDLASRIFFKDETGRPIKNISGFYYTGSDSIFLFDSYSNKMYHLDSSQKLVDSRDFSDILGKNSSENYYLYFNNRYSPFFEGNILVSKAMPSVTQEDQHLQNSRTMVTIDLSSKTANFFAKFPSPYFESPYYSLDYELQSFCPTHLGGGTIAVCFPLESKVYLYEQGNIIKVISIPVADSEVQPVSNRRDRYQMLRNAYHARIIYDKYQKVYYHFTYHSVTFDEEEISGLFTHMVPRPVTISVLNTDFDLIAQNTIPQEEAIFPELAFAAKNGLYVATDRSREDLLTFAVFTIEPK